jgi:quercetin dioxygenase-like cupin family protein
MKPHCWDAIEREQMNPDFSRKVIHTERMTIAQVSMRKGAVVPRHSHENEQVTLVESGTLRFIFDDREVVVSAGEVMQIAPHAPHRVEAIEETVATDLFAPRREDWLRGEDAYLRR